MFSWPYIVPTIIIALCAMAVIIALITTWIAELYGALIWKYSRKHWRTRS